MRKRIKKIIKAECVRLNIEAVNIQELYIVPSDFKKLSNQQIEIGLNLFVKRKELERWERISKENADRYLVIFPTQNRSESRILNRIPEEININDIQLDRLPQSEQEKPAETPKANKSAEPAKEAHPEQAKLSEDEIYEAINKSRHLECVKELPAEQPKQVESTPAKRKSVWDD